VSKGERTRQHLVAEAAKIFNQRGYEGSSMLDIMEAANLQKGGVYRHFSSKEQLAEEAFDYAWKAACEARLGNLDVEKHSLAKIKRFIANFVEVRPPVPGGCPLLNTAIDSDDGNAALRKRAVRALRDWRAMLSKIVQQGVQRGEIRRETDPETVATIVIACLEGALMMNRLEQQNQPMLKAQKHLYGYLDDVARIPE
jgi:TetR/AcrR family transcriptional repressor of nem operon